MMELKGKKCLVTGGAGLIGSHIVDELVLAGVKRIVILDNFHRGASTNIEHLTSNKKIELVNGDIKDRNLVHNISKDIDYVFHQAAVSLLRCLEDPRLCQEVIVDGTFNVLEAARANKIKKLIMASSVSVYGEPSYLPIDEQHFYNSRIPYGAAKIANEQMAIAFHYTYHLPVIILRYFNTYGPRMDMLGAYTEVLMKWLEKIESGESPIIHSDGKQALDFIYVKDVARANILAAKSAISFGIYNIGTSKITSLSELVHMLIALTGSNVIPTFQKEAKRPFVQKRQADIKKAKKELGFIAKTPVLEGLRELIAWRRQRIKR